LMYLRNFLLWSHKTMFTGTGSFLKES
jgi:hypothetical protein